MGLFGAGGAIYLCYPDCIVKFLIIQIIKNHRYQFELPAFPFLVFVGRAAGLLG